MEKYDVYKDIATRCDGDIYIGVVGPVRTGKSTFITRFMENVVLPNIRNKNSRERVRDELPQSGNGKTIMTVEPKFIPNEAVKLSIDKSIDMNVRLIDCVGYLVDDAIGNQEGEALRLVKTPWNDEPIAFEEAATMGTNKVINQHANLGVVVTTDGSITGISREGYINAEERVVAEMKRSNKPYVVLLNSTAPKGEFAQSLAMNLSEKYETQVIPVDVMNLTEREIAEIMKVALLQFDLMQVEFAMPNYLAYLPYNNPIIQDIMAIVKSNLEMVDKMNNVYQLEELFNNSKYFKNGKVTAHMDNGNVVVDLAPIDNLFYQVISSQTGMEIKNDFELIKELKDLMEAKVHYDKIKIALEEVEEKGYGIVSPSLSEMKLEEPQVVEQNGNYGVKLKATAPSMHIMKVDVGTEIKPTVGSKEQGEALIKSLLKDFEQDPNSIWKTDIFGKSLHMVVKDGLENKLEEMPEDVKQKMRKTVSRIVNEGKGGVICILL